MYREIVELSKTYLEDIVRWPGGELHDGDVGARLGQPRLVLGQPEEVQGAGMNRHS